MRIAVAALAVALLVGCGGSDSPSTAERAWVVEHGTETHDELGRLMILTRMVSEASDDPSRVISLCSLATGQAVDAQQAAAASDPGAPPEWRKILEIYRAAFTACAGGDNTVSMVEMQRIPGAVDRYNALGLDTLP